MLSGRSRRASPPWEHSLRWPPRRGVGARRAADIGGIATERPMRPSAMGVSSRAVKGQMVAVSRANEHAPGSGARESGFGCRAFVVGERAGSVDVGSSPVSNGRAAAATVRDCGLVIPRERLPRWPWCWRAPCQLRLTALCRRRESVQCVLKRLHRLYRKAGRAGLNGVLGAFPREGVVAAPRRSGYRVEAQFSGTGLGEPAS